MLRQTTAKKAVAIPRTSQMSDSSTSLPSNWRTPSGVGISNLISGFKVWVGTRFFRQAVAVDAGPSEKYAGLTQAGPWDFFSKFHLGPATTLTRRLIARKRRCIRFGSVHETCWKTCPDKKPRKTHGTWKVVLPLLTIQNPGLTLGFASRFTALCAVQWQTPLKWNQSPELADTNGWQCPCEWSGNMLGLKPWNWNSSGGSDTSLLADSHLNCNQCLG